MLFLKHNSTSVKKEFDDINEEKKKKSKKRKKSFNEN
jgi:hypothetical protein